MTKLGEKLLQLTALRYKRLPELIERLRSGDDYLAGVLQCHLFVESLLEDLIRLCLGTHAEAVLSAQLTFKQKVAVVGKLELEPGWPLVENEAIGSLRKLNSLRNKLAHRYGHELSATVMSYQKMIFAGFSWGATLHSRMAMHWMQVLKSVSVDTPLSYSVACCLGISALRMPNRSLQLPAKARQRFGRQLSSGG